jgi:hypothetical protein
MLRSFITLALMLIFSYSVSLAEDDQIIIEEESASENEKISVSDDRFKHFKNKATIQVLNKITAKIKYLNLEVNSEVDYNSLKIKALSCWKSSPYDLSENKILLQVMDKKIDSTEYKEIFKGWMFSSSPGISSIEHPVYDIVAINCSD